MSERFSLRPVALPPLLCYDDIKKGRDSMTTIFLEIDDTDARLLESYAALQEITAKEYAYRALKNSLNSEPRLISSYNEETQRAIEDIEHGRNLSRRFHSVEDLMEDLNA